MEIFMGKFNFNYNLFLIEIDKSILSEMRIPIVS